MAKPKINGGTTGKGFTAGKSGNPAGRPPKSPELKARCIQAVDEHVVQAWIDEVKPLPPEPGDDPKARPRRGEDWIECSRLLAAYGYGKPVQPIAGEGGEPVSVVFSINGVVKK